MTETHVDLGPLMKRLSCHSDLSLSSRVIIKGLPFTGKSYAASRCIVWEGDPADQVHVILSGWACSYRILGNGRRQVVGYHLPGEMPDLYAIDLGHHDACLASVGHCTMAVIGADVVRAASAACPDLDSMLRREVQLQGCLTRSWLTNVGRRPGLERAAHFLCETYGRLEALGLAEHDRMRLPVCQNDLADALGMTPVHVNRVIQELRSLGLVEWRRHEVILPSRQRLCELAEHEGRDQARQRSRPQPAPAPFLPSPPPPPTLRLVSDSTQLTAP
jgi:CRP-like cAMP-binding protein